MSNRFENEESRDAERLKLYRILRTFAYWSSQFYQRRKKMIFYNRGYIEILQRFLTVMEEEDAYWNLIGVVKAFTFVLYVDIPEGADPSHKLSVVDRHTALKIYMTILNCIIKLHYPEVFVHLKSLQFPIEGYFYDQLITFFANSYSSDLVLRLWDMIVINLATYSTDNRKRALWYVYAAAIY